MKEILRDKDYSPLCPHCGKNVDSYLKNYNDLSVEIQDLEKVEDGKYGVTMRWKEVFTCPFCNNKFYFIIEH